MVNKVLVQRGDSVKAGDVIAELQQEEALDDLRQARDDLTQAERDLADAGTHLAHVEAVHAEGTQEDRQEQGSEP